MGCWAEETGSTTSSRGRERSPTLALGAPSFRLRPPQGVLPSSASAGIPIPTGSPLHLHIQCVRARPPASSSPSTGTAVVRALPPQSVTTWGWVGPRPVTTGSLHLQLTSPIPGKFPLSPNFFPSSNLACSSPSFTQSRASHSESILVVATGSLVTGALARQACMPFQSQLYCCCCC